MVKYRYAFNQDGIVIDVGSLNRKNRMSEFRCIGCGGELIARLGEIRKKHFAHKFDCNCSVETYLHKLAKLTFYNIYKESLNSSKPFILEYAVEQYCDFYVDKFKVDCDLGTKNLEFNLTSYFTKIVLEQKHGNLIPDVRIFNPTTEESIYIEIAVTHKSEQQKISSGNRIIEFHINDEIDLELVQNRRILRDEERIQRYNFKGDFEKRNFCHGKCKCKKSVFLVYESGKAIFVEKNLNDLFKLIKNRKVLDYKVIGSGEIHSNYRPFTYVRNVIASHKRGVKIKNCFLCRYHALNENIYTQDDEPIFCKFLKKTHVSNYAADCEYYRPDNTVYDEYDNER